jgi:peptide/nickel transport system substrate-binding protein
MMRNAFRTNFFTAVIGAGAFLAGCEFHVPKDPETLVWHLGAEPDVLNPLTSTDAYASRIEGLVYDALIERDNQTLEWKPKMAEKWEISPDKLHLTFYLRSGIQWEDGKPVTVDDIIYSFDRIMDPKVDAPHLRVYYQDVEKVEKLDDRTVRFTYKKPYFLALEFCGGIPIIPKHLFDNGEDFNKHTLNRFPKGNGPYRFAGWDTGKRLVLERNENYWGKTVGRGVVPFPDIKRLSLEVVAEDTVALQILKKGELDYAGLRPIQWVRQTETPHFQRLFNKYQYYTPGYSFIGWNMKRPYFADAKVRRAMTMLVNRASILEKLNFGLGRIVSGPFYYDSKAYNHDVKPLPYDPGAAKGLLAEAGWKDTDGDGLLDKDGRPFRFEFLIPSGRRFAERLSTILKEDLRKVGIDMEIRKLEWAVFIKNLDERTFDAVTLSWVFGFDQDPYQVWHSTQAGKGSNFVGFASPEADRIIEEARTEFDREKREAMYRRFHVLVDELQPYTFLFSSPSLVALHKRFENVKVYPGGMDMMEWKVNKGFVAAP